MRRFLGTLFTFALTSMVLALIPMGAVAGPNGEPQGPSGLAAIQVWNANLGKMGCEPANQQGEYTEPRDFAQYISDYEQGNHYLPDIITVQEVGNGSDQCGGAMLTCEDFVHRLEAWIAYESDKTVNYACEGTLSPGGAAVVYRTAKFKLMGSPIAFSEWKLDGGDCALSDGWRGQAVWLRETSETTNQRDVAVASIHFPSDPDSQLFDCAESNIVRAHNTLTSFRSAPNTGKFNVRIIAGDVNHMDGQMQDPSTGEREDYFAFQRWTCWYSRVVGGEYNAPNPPPKLDSCTTDTTGSSHPSNLQYADVIREATLAQPSPPTTDLDLFIAMRDYHWTRERLWPGTSQKYYKRIDFLLTRCDSDLDGANFTPCTPSNVVTVDWEAADYGINDRYYSDHRGQGALINWQ